MVSPLWLVFVCQAIVVASCFLHASHSGPSDPGSTRVPRGDAGAPLFLSPLLKAGRAAEARHLARVHLPGPTLESYAGYFTVNQTYNSNHFLWYFPSVVEPKDSAPVLLWLQGGPGVADTSNIFNGNGPFVLNQGYLELRQHHWALNHHLIYIDSPVGTGFSFTESEQGYCTDEVQVSAQLYSTLTQFFQLFPELQQKKFFIAGESYGGKYVPALAFTIHNNNPTAKTMINLHGIAIGNGLCDPVHQLGYSELMYQTGNIDWNDKKKIEVFEAQAISYIKNKEWLEAHAIWLKILDIIDKAGINVYNIGYPHPHTLNNFLQDFEYYLDNNSVRNAIHVGDQPFVYKSGTVYHYLKEDMMQSVAPWISELLNHYSVVTYNGQLDVIVSYPLTVNFLRHLHFSGSEEYETAARHQWWVRGQLAGFWKRAGRLTEVLVRGAGHMVPMDQPEFAWDMISKVTHGGYNQD